MRLHLHRLFTSPTVRVQSADADRTVVHIDGLVCDDVCAVRSQRALSQLDGVRNVTVDFDAGTATIEGAPHSEAEYQRALDSVVAGKPLRRWLESIHRAPPRALGATDKK